jgi:Flp pilus assembly protein TadD
VRFAPVILAAFLAVDPWGFDRFGPLRFLLVSVLGFAVVAAGLVGGTCSPLPRSVRHGAAALFGGLVLSTLLAADRWHALIGTPDRHFGLVTWVLCAGLFVVAHGRATVDPEATTTAVLRALTVATLGVGLYSVAEILEVGSLDQDFANDRIGGPWGQPAFLGAAMTIGIPASVAHARAEVGVMRVVATVAAGLGTIALLNSQARAAWVGLALAAGLLLAFRRHQLHVSLGPKRAGIGAGAVVGVLLMVAVFTPAGARAWSLTDVSDGVVAGRIDEWQVGLRALADTGTVGVFGHGPENYRTVFGEHVDQAYVMDHGRDTFTDRAHNSGLDVALAGGLVSAAGWMAVLAVLGRDAWTALRTAGSTDTALAAGLVAYFVQGFFLFPLAEVEPVVWIIAGVFLARTRTASDPTTTSPSTSTGLASAVAGGLALAAAVAFAVVGVLDVLADHRIRSAASTESAAVALDHADAARRLRPDSIRYHFAAARIAASQPNGAGVDDAIERIEDGLAWSPVDPALRHERSLVLVNEARRTVDPDDIAAALEPLAELDRTDPNHPEGQQRYGIALALDGQTDLAIDQFEHAAYMTPDRPEALLNLAFVHIGEGDTAAATDAVLRAWRVAPDDDRVRRLVAELGIVTPDAS